MYFQSTVHDYLAVDDVCRQRVVVVQCEQHATPAVQPVDHVHASPTNHHRVMVAQ
jgi:hypothetical protein